MLNIRRVSRAVALALVFVAWASSAFAAFSYYKTFTTDATQAGTADSSNFPITIAVTDADLKTVANGGYVQNANGYDIRPYSDSGLTTALTFELVYYNASTGQVEMHVNVGTLSHTTNLVSYLAFGDATISTDGSSTSTWNSGYKTVLHLKDGTTLSVSDATTLTTPTNHSATATAGQIDGAAAFASGSSQYIDNGSLTLGSTVASGSAWVNGTTQSAAQSIHKNWGSVTGGQFHFGTDVTNGTHFSIYITQSNGTSKNVDDTSAFSTGTWYHVAWRADGSNLRLYKNGAEVGTAAAYDGTLRTSFTSTFIGAKPSDGGTPALSFLNGNLDEVRYSADARSASWYTAEYNNQKASSTFLTWGSRTAVSTSTSPGLLDVGVGPG